MTRAQPVAQFSSPKATGQYYDTRMDPGLTRLLPRSSLTRVGPATTDLWSYGYGELWVDGLTNPYKYADVTRGTPAVNDTAQRIERTDTWTEWTPDRKREHLTVEIYAQVPQHSASDVIIDNEKQEIVDSWNDQAYVKVQELFATPDDQLDAFDPTLSLPVRVAQRAESTTLVAKAPPLTWALMFRGQYEQGKEYLTNTMVYDGKYIGISKRMTTDSPAPKMEQGQWVFSPDWDLLPTFTPPVNIRAWVQPTGGHDAYAKGDLVRHNGFIWESDVDANVWEPGVSNWTQNSNQQSALPFSAG